MLTSYKRANDIENTFTVLCLEQLCRRMPFRSSPSGALGGRHGLPNVLTSCTRTTHAHYFIRLNGVKPWETGGPFLALGPISNLWWLGDRVMDALTALGARIKHFGLCIYETLCPTHIESGGLNSRVALSTPFLLSISQYGQFEYMVYHFIRAFHGSVS